jgi:hypothetical protein
MNSSRLFCKHGSLSSPQIYKAPVTRTLLQSEQAEGEVRLFARPKKKLSSEETRRDEGGECSQEPCLSGLWEGSDFTNRVC